MTETKKQQKKQQKKSNIVIVTKTYVPASETLFPEKVKKAEEILKKTKFMDGFFK